MRGLDIALLIINRQGDRGTLLWYFEQTSREWVRAESGHVVCKRLLSNEIIFEIGSKRMHDSTRVCERDSEDVSGWQRDEELV